MQVQKLQKALKAANLPDIRVGSVEEFQGQESRVIIISTVRSSQEYLPLDSHFKLGFLRNPKVTIHYHFKMTRKCGVLKIASKGY